MNPADYSVTTEKSRLDIDAIHSYLTRSYWAEGRSKETVSVSVENSVCFGLLHKGKQIGFARVITDYSTYAYLCDVYVLEEHRGLGLGKRLVESVISDPRLRNVKWSLVTSTAHGLYEKFGFRRTENPERIMVRPKPSC